MTAGTGEGEGGECEATWLPGVTCQLPKQHAGLHFSHAWALRWPDFVSEGHDHVS